jgi:hypothetical protein
MVYDGEDDTEVPERDEDVRVLNAAWQTEVHCPEVLPFRAEVVESVTRRVADQQVSE